MNHIVGYRVFDVPVRIKFKIFLKIVLQYNIFVLFFLIIIKYNTIFNKKSAFNFIYLTKNKMYLN